MIKLMIADDHTLFREGMKSLLRNEKDIDLVGTASNGADAVTIAEKLKPDVVLMDLSMPDMNGITATKKIMAQLPKTRVIILSMYNDRCLIASTFKAGGRAYLLKESTPETVIETIRSVMDGNIYLSPKACTVLVEDYLRMCRSSSKSGVETPLSERETEVLRLLAKGKNSKQAAAILSISKNTVDTHRRRIMNKLGCESTAELTKYAIREGFLTLE